jgi:hypothetical protein
MNNISSDKLHEIAAKTSSLIQTINTSVHWAETYMSQDKNLNFELKKYRRKIRKIENVITGKPVIAFFGASQVGKSYMVNSLLCDDSKKLFLLNHLNREEKIDFIKEINPEGHGNESTSVITRFSTEKARPDKKPIKLKLLTARDLICILCDSYYQDVKDKNTHSHDERVEQIKTHIDALEGFLTKEQHNYISDDDIYDIQEYLEHNLKHSGNHPFELFNKLGFWHQLAKSISFIKPEKWADTFGILWNNHSYISKFFNDLISELGKLNFSRFAYADFNAVKRNEGAILDVQTLDGIYQSEKNKYLKVQTEENKIVDVKNSVLCALCAEVIFSIEANYSSELKNKITQNIDVLDFPGARTRLELQEESIGDINVKEMILRGKVSYLFNSASANYEINNLFVCMRTSQTNVRGVPGLIKDWIDYNIGETPEERYKTLEESETPPLFLIFTWWNTLLGYSSATDSADPKERLQKWLKTRFKEEIIADFDWNSNWVKNDFSINSFNNFYLLRDFIKSYETNKIFDRKYENENKTIYKEIVSHDDDQNNFLTIFKQDFISSDLVKEFFKDPELNWNEASIPDKDGTELILNNILKIANNRTRTKRYVNQLLQWTKELISTLNRHHHSDNADEEILKASRDVAEIHGFMNMIFGQNAFHFGDFIEKLTISEKEIKILYHDKLNDTNLIAATNPEIWIHFLEYSPRLSPANSYEENLQILREDYHLDSSLSAKETEDYFFNKFKLDVKLMLSHWNTQKDKSLVLSNSAVELWKDSRLSLNRFETYINMGFDKVLLSKLLENIQKTFDRLELAKSIARIIGPFVDRPNRLYEAEDMIAHITATVINNFIHDLGWEHFEYEEIKFLEELNKKNNLRMTLPVEDSQFEVLNNQSIEELFDFMSNLNENLRKIPIDEGIIRKIPMIKNYRKWRDMIKVTFVSNCNIPNYDLEANRQLGDILNVIKKVDFSIA